MRFSAALRTVSLVGLMSAVVGEVWSQTAPPTPLASADLVREGRDIYRGAGSRDISARIDGSDLWLSHRQMRCVQCHRGDARGGREGGTRAPSIRWASLSATSKDANHPVPYDVASFLGAVTRGISADGRTLSAAMPRFDVTPREGAALAAYLQALDRGAVPDPGLADHELRLGVVAPTEGPYAPQGQATVDALTAFVNRTNLAGGIYGRRLTLVVQPCDSTAESAARATAALARADIFALVATADYWPGPAIRNAIETAAVPSVGALGAAELSAKAGAYSFDLLPPLRDQFRALVDHFADQGAARIRLAVPSEAATSSSTVALVAAVEQQARVRGLAVVPLGARAAKVERGDAVVFVGGSRDFSATLAAVDGDVLVGTSIGAMTSQLGSVPPDRLVRLRVVSPIAPPDMLPLDALRRALADEGHSFRMPAVQALAWSSAEVVVAGLLAAGSELTRDSFTAALSDLDSIPTLALPRLGFRNQGRQGLRGAFILAADRNSGDMRPVSGWVTPRDGLR